MKIKNVDFKYLCCFEVGDKSLFYNISKGKWMPVDRWCDDAELEDDEWSTCYPCKSVRAAKRHLRNHDEIPKGYRFVLMSCWEDCDVVLCK